MCCPDNKATVPSKLILTRWPSYFSLVRWCPTKHQEDQVKWWHCPTIGLDYCIKCDSLLLCKWTQDRKPGPNPSSLSTSYFIAIMVRSMALQMFKSHHKIKKIKPALLSDWLSEPVSAGSQHNCVFNDSGFLILVKWLASWKHTRNENETKRREF